MLPSFHGNNERGDELIAKIDNCCKILRTYLIGNMKPHDSMKSDTGSLAYSSWTIHTANNFDTQLSFSYTCHKVKLYMVQSLNKKMGVIEIIM